MSNCGPSIKVHSESNIVFSWSKSVQNSCNNLNALVGALRDAQVQVNQHLTEMVVKNGDQNKNQGCDDEASDEDDKEDEEDEKMQEASISFKREMNKIDDLNSDATQEKRVKL